MVFWQIVDHQKINLGKFPMLHQIAIMLNNLKKPFLILAGILILSTFALYKKGIVLNSPMRMRAEHSIVLPESADEIQYDHFFNISIMGDFQMEVTFTIEKSDLPYILNQFEELELSQEDKKLRGFDLPPKSFQQEVDYLRCFSKDGNIAFVVIYDLDKSKISDKVGIHLVTIWN